jgi:hypothetical protein
MKDYTMVETKKRVIIDLLNSQLGTAQVRKEYYENQLELPEGTPEYEHALNMVGYFQGKIDGLEIAIILAK